MKRRVEYLQEILDYTKENNKMLRYIVSYINHHRKTDDVENFGINVLANLLSNNFKSRF